MFYLIKQLFLLSHLKKVIFTSPPFSPINKTDRRNEQKQYWKKKKRRKEKRAMTWRQVQRGKNENTRASAFAQASSNRIARIVENWLRCFVSFPLSLLYPHLSPLRGKALIYLFLHICRRAAHRLRKSLWHFH